jgi:hypothetical protein
MAFAVGPLAITATAWTAASASVSRPQDLHDQLAASEIVVEGHVDRMYPCPNAVTGVPRTCAAVSAATFFKGGSGSGKVILLFPGGQLPDGSSVRMAGAPDLHAGETVIASAIVKPGSDAMLVLSNFGAALLRRQLDVAGHELAADGVGRPLGQLPLVGAARYLPAAGAAPSGDGDAGAPPPPAPPPLTWADARRAIADGLRAVASAHDAAKPARTILGASGNEGVQP